MTNIKTPELGDKITFSRIPNGSYATVGIKYLVTGHCHGTISIQRTDTGAGTFDNIRMYRHAVWSKSA